MRLSRKSGIMISGFTVLMLIFIILLKCFTDLLGKPVYIFSDSYNEHHSHIFRTDSAERIVLNHQYQPYFALTKNNLKYCDHLDIFDLFEMHVENLDFLEKTHFSELCLYSADGVEDWSGLQFCTDLKTVILGRNFSDVSLLSGNTELKELRIITTESLINLETLTEFHDLSVLSLMFLYDEPLLDLQELPALSVKELHLDGRELHFEEIQKFDSLEILSLSRLPDNWKILTEMPSLKELHLNNAYLDEEQMKQVSPELEKYGIEISYF
ncbi:MAG: leucine-rich repeat domain-containing protein [Oscillospiraceae bacterium]|nr:leucine-rich repeat domain-containing protein [Oscillospiraceae bacterium]